MDEPSQNSILPIKADCSDLWIFRGLIPKQDKFIFNDGVGLSSLKKTFCVCYKSHTTEQIHILVQARLEIVCY